MDLIKLMEQWFSREQAIRMSMASKKEEKERKRLWILTNQIEEVETTNLNDIKWIWPSTIKTLLENGIKTIEDLEKVGMSKIKEIIKSPISIKALENLTNK